MVNKKKLIIIIIAILLLVLLIMFLKQFVIVNPQNEISEEYIPEQEISEEDYRKTIVTLYFAEKENGKLVQEGRLIDSKLLLEKPYDTLIQMLILGPEASSYSKLIPDGTILNKTELKGDLLEIDFSKEFLNTENSEKQNLIIESIKKTVTSLNEVNNISIFVNGEKIN